MSDAIQQYQLRALQVLGHHSYVEAPVDAPIGVTPSSYSFSQYYDGTTSFGVPLGGASKLLTFYVTLTGTLGAPTKIQGYFSRDVDGARSLTPSISMPLILSISGASLTASAKIDAPLPDVKNQSLGASLYFIGNLDAGSAQALLGVCLTGGPENGAYAAPV